MHSATHITSFPKAPPPDRLGRQHNFSTLLPPLIQSLQHQLRSNGPHIIGLLNSHGQNQMLGQLVGAPTLSPITRAASISSTRRSIDT